MNTHTYGFDAHSLGLQVTGYSGLSEVICKCPNPNHNDSNPSASFNVESGLLYCFSCGYATNAYKLAKQAGVVLERKPIVINKQDSDELWKEFERLPLAMDNEYLIKRGLTNLDVAEFDIRKTRKGVIFLFKNLRNKLTGCQMRQYGATPKYLTFGERTCFDLRQYKHYTPDRPIYLVEGVFGMIKGYQSGYQTIATIGAMLKESSLEFLKNWKTVYGVFDHDEAGLRASLKLLNIIPQAKIVLGFTADTDNWNFLHSSYVTTGNIQDIISLSSDRKRILGYGTINRTNY